jgi:phospholipid/cholesterol/gamma-HCH transport system substrate-binding protein
MQSNRTLELGTGLFVLLGFVALFFLATQLPSSGLKLSSEKRGFHVSADFDNIGDLKVGSPVTMAGVSVGEVAAIRLDPKTYQAVVGLRIYPKYNEIPDDSFASIQTQGLLGGKYIGLSPGGSETFLKEGSHIDQTQSAIVLESLINKLFASFANKAGGGDSQSQAQPQSQSPSPSAPAADPKKPEPKK